MATRTVTTDLNNPLPDGVVRVADRPGNLTQIIVGGYPPGRVGADRDVAGVRRNGVPVTTLPAAFVAGDVFEVRGPGVHVHGGGYVTLVFEE